MKTRHVVRHIANAGAAAILLVAGLGTPDAVAAPQTALDCSHSWRNVSSQYGRIVYDGVNMRTGPHTSCTAVSSIAYGTGLYAHCWTYGDSVDGYNIWWHVRKEGTSTQGWILDRYAPHLPRAQDKC
ncbi:hypothetical protein AB0N23_00355 [Streptomyces sp. NPDC052644]